jgi:5,10-methenyltetrahydrofolate synthetase
MKAELRSRLLVARDALSALDRARHSDAITDQIVDLDAYQQARTVMAYMTFGSEFMTERFVTHALDHGKRLVLPKVRRADQRLSLHVVRDLRSDLGEGPWGIREPKDERTATATIDDVDFVLVPGLGFTANGIRLGYGRGYYDRLLEHRAPYTALVAAAYQLQLVDHIPADAYDVPVHLIVTERGMHRREDASALGASGQTTL